MSGIDEGDDKRDLDRVTKVFDMNFNDQQLMVKTLRYPNNSNNPNNPLSLYVYIFVYI